MLTEPDPLARGRARVERRPEGLRIEIPAKREWWLLAFLLVWLAGWTAGGVAAIANLAGGGNDTGDTAFLLLWLVLWGLAWVAIACVLGWNLLGRELVTVTGAELAVERRAGPYHSEKRFARDRIERLRTDARRRGLGGLFTGLTDSWRAQWEVYGLGGGSVVLDYGARTHRFGSKLDEAESRLLVEQIAKELRLRPPAVAPERPEPF